MNDDQLQGTLKSIGKACFVNYFPKFSDAALSDEALARILVEREGWDEATALNFRVRGARRIIKVGRAKDALILIVDSQRMSKTLKSRALSLLQRL